MGAELILRCLLSRLPVSAAVITICDTGPLLAYLNRNDPYREWAVALMKSAMTVQGRTRARRAACSGLLRTGQRIRLRGRRQRRELFLREHPVQPAQISQQIVP